MNISLTSFHQFHQNVRAHAESKRHNKSSHVKKRGQTPGTCWEKVKTLGPHLDCKKTQLRIGPLTTLVLDELRFHIFQQFSNDNFTAQQQEEQSKLQQCST